MGQCPVAPQECLDDDACDNCLNFMNTCDECLEAGHMDAAGWNEGRNGETLCNACFDKQKGRPRDH